MSERFKLRRDTDANWTANNPVLGEGEPGFAIDTGILKIGDGVTAWFELAGISGGGGGGSSYPLVDPGGTGDYLTIPDAFADGVYEMSLIAGMHQIAVPVEIDLTTIDRTKRMGFYGNHMNDTVVNAVDFAAISFLDVIMPVLTGTCTWPAGTGQITGTSTAFISECTVGDYIGKGDADVMGKIISIESNTAMTVEGLNPWGFTDTAFVLGYFPDFYVEDIRFTSDEANCSFFDFSEYMANCNIYIKNVINETKGMFYDNSGAINRLTRLYDLHETSWG
ncbi:MAG: hypothetical protein IZT57_05250, partial [Chloroflexi bacterium]|nr:hypothetical protein [Chloroflexota bacterium]